MDAISRTFIHITKVLELKFYKLPSMTDCIVQKKTTQDNVKLNHLYIWDWTNYFVRLLHRRKFSKWNLFQTLDQKFQFCFRPLHFDSSARTWNTLCTETDFILHMPHHPKGQQALHPIDVTTKACSDVLIHESNYLAHDILTSKVLGWCLHQMS